MWGVDIAIGTVFDDTPSPNLNPKPWGVKLGGRLAIISRVKLINYAREIIASRWQTQRGGWAFD